jgi:hypothetical protein
MEIIHYGFYHGDVRPPNIVVNTDFGDNPQFTIIDWDEVCTTWMERSAEHDRRYPIVLQDDRSQYAMVLTACQLLACVGIIDLAATREADSCHLEQQWRDEEKFWVCYCPNNDIHSWAGEIVISNLLRFVNGFEEPTEQALLSILREVLRLED